MSLSASILQRHQGFGNSPAASSYLTNEAALRTAYHSLVNAQIALDMATIAGSGVTAAQAAVTSAAASLDAAYAQVQADRVAQGTGGTYDMNSIMAP